MRLNLVNLQTDINTRLLEQQGKMEKELQVDEQGGLQIPAKVLQEWGIAPGTKLLVNKDSGGILLSRSDPSLAKVYVEPTNACNLNCSTCARHSWKEPIGTMSMDTYHQLIRSLREVPSLKKVSFWGLGEPLLHPHIVEMVALAKELGAETQLITNALLLDRDRAEGLVAAGLDSIVVSVDGASPQAQADIRSGADLGLIERNINQLRAIRRSNPRRNPEIGIEFVVMRRNVNELGNLRQLAYSLGASFIVLTNLLPYTEEMQDETLYWKDAYRSGRGCRSEIFPEIFMAPMDIRSDALEPLLKLAGYGSSVSTSHFRVDIDRSYCRFVGEGSAVVAWDGELSPCIALMHSYSCYVMSRKKEIKRYTLGNVGRENISNIWNRQDFIRFRKAVQRFDFSPCVDCSGCELAESNEEDCYGNTHPVCGDCLWARGVIQCP